MHAIGIEAKGPRGEPLCIDIAWFGAARPRGVFMHTTGLHGVEAFTGSAAQLAFLDALPVPGPEDALALVHVLNPFGMAWLRRTNENNVDLNRNFLMDGERYEGAPPLYRTLDPLLNPKSPPAHDAFRVRAPAFAVAQGPQRFKHAIAEGQYEYESGLFFGGRSMELGPRLFSAWLERHVGAAQYLFALDLHTGLGRRGSDTLLSSPHEISTARDMLTNALGRKVVDPSGPSVAYTVRGGFGAALHRLLPGTRVDFVLQEIGTYPALAVLHALREENRWHFYGTGDLDHAAKRRLREVLCPAAVEWRRRAVSRALTAARAAAQWTFSAAARVK